MSAGRRMTRIILMTWILLGSVALAESKFVDSQTSGSGRLKISRFEDGQTGTCSLFLTAPNRKESLLYRSDRAVTAKFSPDETFIILDDRYASNASEVIVFGKGKDQEYRELKLRSLSGRVLGLISAHYQLSSAPFDHFYLVSRDWADNHTINLRAWGHGEAGALDDWICSYDLSNDKLIVSLEALKKAKFQKKS
jgi:hypothetical protein